MPKTAIPLNDTRIKALKPKAERYLVSDGGGLALEGIAKKELATAFIKCMNFTLQGE
jgi:hypothetical protein